MRRNPAKRAGISVTGLLLAFPALVVAAGGLAAVLTQGLALSAVSAETSDAQAFARRVIARVAELPAEQVFVACNGTAADDPDGMPDAPGPVLTLDGGEETGPVTATLVFPVGDDPSVLREDVVIPELGMPRDLNGDGSIDSADHSKDYRILPLLVRVQWVGFHGARTVEVAAALECSRPPFDPTRTGQRSSVTTAR